MNGLLQDVRYALRQLKKTPGFTVIAALTLAVGIGANTAVFSVLEAFFLRPLPGKEPDRLAWISAKTPQGPDSISYADYRDLAAQSKSLEGILACSRRGQFLRIGTETSEILDDVVSPNYFSVLRIEAQLGRTFQPEDGATGEPAVVISDTLWHRAFNGDRSLLGKQIWLTKKSYTVIGIAPPRFRGLANIVPTDLWVLATNEDSPQELADRNFRDFELLGRLRPGVTREQAEVELGVIGRRLAEAYPEVDKAREIILEAKSPKPVAVILFMAPSGLVLLICCANIAGMLLARSETRRREVALRSALGAGRHRLIRQLFTESVLLVLAGAGMGLILVLWLFRLQPALIPPMQIELGLDLRLNTTVLAFAAGASVVAAIAFGLAPALQATKHSVVSALKGNEPIGRRVVGRLVARNALVLGEIGVSVVLLTTSGLLVRSLLFSRGRNIGFDKQKNLIFVSLNPGLAGYEGERTRIYLDNVQQRLAGLPGVRQVSYANRALLSGSGGGRNVRVSIPGFELPQGQPNIPIKFNAVGAGYFRIMGTRLLQGRDFSSEDSRSGPAVVIVSQSMARRFWPGQDAIGRHIVVEGTSCQIVGVAEDATINEVHEGVHETPEPYMYFPFAQWGGGDATIIVETAGNPRDLVATVRGEILKLNPDMIIYDIQTMHSLMQQAFWLDNMAAGSAVALGGLGVFLAALGLYGVIAYVVSRRQQEIGIRMAMGAERGTVMRMVLAQGLRTAVIGMGLGLVASLGTMRLLSSMLYGVKPTDPISMLGSAAAVTLVAIAATYFPARRAAKVDPMVALRYE
jgi:predicted permease